MVRLFVVPKSIDNCVIQFFIQPLRPELSHSALLQGMGFIVRIVTQWLQIARMRNYIEGSCLRCVAIPQASHFSQVLHDIYSRPAWHWPFQHLKIYCSCHGWCGSVGWALACEPQGHRLDSQSGHLPGLRARSPGRGTQEVMTHWCFSPSLSPFPSV